MIPLALTETEGVILTVVVVILIAVVLGVLVISDDSNWFD